MAGSQTLAFDIVGNASSAARAFKDTADSAAVAARGVKDASRALDMQTRSATVAAGATLALARADRILADAELGLARDTAVATAVLGKQNAALLGSATAGAVGSMLAAAASGKAPTSGGGNGLAPGLAMAAAAMGVASVNTRRFSDSISAGTPVWDGARKGIFGLNGELLLFGGALKSVGIPNFLSAATTVHLLTEAIVETAGTLIPATIAFGAFGVAAVPTVQAIYKQMSNLYTISQATGTQIPGLTGNFSKMAAAVQPEVYTLFGEGLVFASKSTGTFQQLATGAGRVLDGLGARFVAATTQGKGFSTFAGKAVGDLQAWGTGIGNVGGIIGNLLKVLPGYAEDLASVFDGVTHAIEVVTGSKLGQWVLGIGLAAHGAIFYIGILGTGLSVLASRTLALVATGALRAATAVEGLGAAGAAASGGLLAFGAAADGAAALPWGWISIAVAGLGFLAYQLANVKDAAQQFDTAMQNAVTNAPLNQLAGTISTSIAATQARVASSARDVTAALKDQQPAVQGVASRYEQSYNPALDQAATNSLHYSQGLQQLQAQQQLVASRVGALAKEYGGQANALGLLNDAGITSAQVTDKSSYAWAQVLIELQAANLATKEMNVNTGALGSNYVNTLLPAVQKVTQAQDTQINAIVGSQQAIVTWAQGLAQASKDAKVHGAALSGLNTQSLVLANDYYSTLIPASQKLIDALEAQGASTTDLRTAVADEVAQMLPFTRGNLAAKSVLVDLVNNALGPGTVSLQNLSKWTGTNSGTMAGFKAIVDKATVSAGNLAGTLSGLLNSAFAADILKASGATGALDAYTNAIVHGNAGTAAGRADRAALISDLEKAGYSARDATSYVDGLQKKIDAMHGTTVKVGVVASATGKLTATESGALAGQGVTASQFIMSFLAGGGQVGGTGNTDSVPAMLTPGEVVVPKGMVAAGAVDHLRGSLPGFASGGLVGAQDYVATTAGSFAAHAGLAFAKAADAAFRKSIAAASAAVPYSKVAGVTQWEGTALKALAMLGLPSSDLVTVMSQIQTESGGNPNIVNKWDSNWIAGHPSVGLMQVIAGTFDTYAGPFRNTGPFEYGVSANPLANIYAGLNYAIHQYGNPGWLGVLGHGHGYAGGTSSAAPGWAWVGENGPEIVRFGGGEQVIPNRAIGGGGVHVHLHNAGVIGSRSELENWLVDSLNSAARGGRLRWALTQSPSSR